MNYKDLSRPLDISDVDFRVQSINNGGYATILAYKDARVDMIRLDEVLTPLGWQRDYKLIDGKLFCGVGIWHKESCEWVWKWDVGTESNTEKEKGQASDSFKRACFNLGIGRELYDYPIISVKLNDDEWSKDGGKPRQTFNLKIKDWRWYSEFTDGKISFLAAKDQNGNLRFKWGVMKPKEAQAEPTYKPASGGEPVADETAPTQPQKTYSPPTEAEEANVQGVLKKSAADPERELLAIEYEQLMGKKPHHKLSIEKMKEEVIKASNEAKQEVLAEVEEPMVDEAHEEEDELTLNNHVAGILDHIDDIKQFDEPSSFVAWAKSIVGEYIDIEDEENISTFKTMCNDHYAKIVK